MPPPHPSLAAPYAAVGTLLLTSASFQSPGMQKDSSRSLPHRSKIRSSGEGNKVGTGVNAALEHIQLSASPLINTQMANSCGSSTQLFQAPLHHGVCSEDTFACPAHLQTLLSPVRGITHSGKVLVCLVPRGFWGHGSYHPKPGWLVTLERQSWVCDLSKV